MTNAVREPKLQLHRAPCPRCGAKTVTEAETACRPERDETGEGTCPSVEFDADAEGYLLQPTPAYLRLLDDYYEALPHD